MITGRLLCKTSWYETVLGFHLLIHSSDACCMDLKKLSSEVILGLSNEKPNSSKELKVALFRIFGGTFYQYLIKNI